MEIVKDTQGRIINSKKSVGDRTRFVNIQGTRDVHESVPDVGEELHINLLP